MATTTTKDGTTIFYKDWGPKDAQPIVFHHGWPLSSDDWDAQMLFFLANGYRVVAHKLLKHGTLKMYPGFSHGMMTTNAEVINADILAFIKGAAVNAA
jgi:non-heme chloroperoxidase